MPSANGVITEETANRFSAHRAAREESATPRSAYAAPRKMIPIAAISSGAARVEVIEPNATGYAVQHTTSTKISQT